MHVVPGGIVFPWELPSRSFWTVDGGTKKAGNKSSCIVVELLFCRRALATMDVRCFEAGRDFPTRFPLCVPIFCSSQECEYGGGVHRTRHSYYFFRIYVFVLVFFLFLPFSHSSKFVLVKAIELCVQTNASSTICIVPSKLFDSKSWLA